MGQNRGHWIEEGWGGEDKEWSWGDDDDDGSRQQYQCSCTGSDCMN